MSQLPSQPTTQAMLDAAAQQAAEIHGAAPILPEFLAPAVPPQVTPPQAAQPQVAQQPVQQPAQQQQPAQVAPQASQPQPQVVMSVAPEATAQPAQVPAVQQPQSTSLAAMQLQVPEWLAAATQGKSSGTEELKNLIIPPKLLVRQQTAANQDLIQRTDIVVGDMFIMPDMRKVFSFAEKIPVKVTPIHFYREWTLENPHGMKPRRVAQTFDANNVIAINAMNADKRQGRQVGMTPQGQPAYQSHVQYMNYLCVLHIADAPLMPVLVSFSRTGILDAMKWNTLITGRSQQPLWSCVFNLTTSIRQGNGNTWFGIDVSNCVEQPWITPEQVPIMESLHNEFKTKQASGQIASDDDDDAATAVESPVQYAQQHGMQPQQQYPQYPQPQYGPQGYPQQYPPQGYPQQFPQQGFPPQAAQGQQPNYGHAPIQQGDPNAALNQAANQQRGGYPGGSGF
jgi:hypothetical protein